MQNTRSLALEILLQKTNTVPFPLLLEKAYKKLKEHEHIKQEKAFLMALCYGVLRYQGIINALLIPYQKQKNSSFFETNLSLALFELFFLQKKQDHAILNEYVEILKKKEGQKKANVLNAILRAMLKDKETLEQQIQNLTQKIQTKIAPNQIPSKKNLRQLHNLADLAPIFTQELDPLFYQQITEESFYTPKPSFRINTQKTKELPSFIQSLSTSIFFCEEQEIIQLKDLEEQGYISRQGVSSALLTEELANFYHAQNLKNGVWDMCCGRGGKSLGLLEKNIPVLFATEPNAQRIQDFQNQLQRLSLKEPCIKQGLAQNITINFPPNIEKNFSLLLLDSPCSTSGTIARNPEVKYRITQENLTQILQTQQELLETAWNIVEKNSFLCYCTCSLFQKENKVQIQTFLKKHKNAQCLFEKYLIPSNLDPKLKGHDILFYAILQKISL